MNLKRLRGIYAVALITIAAALFAGCQNSMAGSVDGNTRGVATLSISATGIPNDYAEQFAKSYPTAATVASRSITPQDPFDINNAYDEDYVGQSNGLVFVLTGKSETGKVLGDTTVLLKLNEDTTEGYNFYTGLDPDKPVVLDSMSWNLKLVAKKNNVEVLQGFCSVDLRNGSGTAKFTMGTAGLSAAGSVTLGGTIVDTSDSSLYYTMGIYRKDTGDLVTGTKQTGTLSTNGGANETFAYTKTPVDPGTYLYTMIFYDKEDANTNLMNIVGSFTDTLIVDPGNDLERQGILIDVIGKKPEPPTHLQAFLVDNSESTDGRTYEVIVAWTKGKYETNYELNLVESADLSDLASANDGTAIINGKVYGMASMDKTGAVDNFASSDIFGKGSSYMMYGDESCVLKLETGKMYEIQLRARNYIGTSEWADREEGNFTIYDKLTNCVPYVAPEDQVINRLLITYNLNGGVLKLDDTATPYTDKYATYKSWKIDGTGDANYTDDLLKITGAIELKKGGADFENWLLESGKGADDDGAEVATIGDEVEKFIYSNLTVKASFGNKVTGSIEQEQKKQDIEFDDLTITVNENVLQTVAEKSAVIDAPKVYNNGTVGVIQIELKNNTTVNPNRVYNNIKFFVKRETSTYEESIPYYMATTNMCNISLDNYSTGKLTVRVEADTNIPSVSRTLIFDLN